MDALARALAAFPLAAPRVERIPHGLVNESFAVRDGAVEYVLQRVSPIFQVGIHENLRAVSEHLAALGLATQRLVPTREGRLFADFGEDGRWRLLARLPGITFDVCSSAAQAEAAGGLVGRFHAALADFAGGLRPLGIPLHDTAAYLADLERALAAHPGHRLAAHVGPLAAEIAAAAAGCVPPAGLPARVVHGDLKFNNVLFAGPQGPASEQAVALIDLDTVTRLPLWTDLGDAWRSWCNRAGEDSPRAELDLECLRAAAGGYLAACDLELGPAERASLALAPERVSLELAARFAADALAECYFGFDARRFGSRGEHNLVRARGQLSLACQLRDARAALARLVA